MANPYKSLQALAPLTSLLAGNKMLVVLAPGNDGSQGTTDTIGQVDLTTFQSFMLATVNSQIAALQAKPGNGAFATPVTMTLTGPVTGSTTFDGSANFGLTTTIANGALTVAMVSGLSTTLTSLQNQINGLQPALGFTPVQQGTGIGQQTNVVKIGWTASNTLNATVDSTDLGALATQSWANGRFLTTGANAVTASRWAAPMALSLTGDVTGSVSFDGSAAASLATTLAGGYKTALNGLAGSVDLNTITGAGNYIQTANTQAASGANYPIALAGMLEVYNTAGFVWQRYTVYNDATNNGGHVYIRSYYNTAWTAWRLLPFTNDNITGLAAGWSTPRTLTLTGPITGSVSWDGTGNASLATSMNTSGLAPISASFGTASGYTDLNAAQTTYIGSWTPTSANITSMDQYGVVMSVSSMPSLTPQNSNWLNQLCFGTNGTLGWRYNINGGGWTVRTLWHSGNFTPSNYVQNNQNGVVLGNISVGTSASPLLYESDGTNHSLGVRTGPSTAFKYFTFGYDGSFSVPNGNLVCTGGEIQGAAANAFRMTYGNYGIIWRSDGGTLYLMKTASGSPLGSWDATRPLVWNYASGGISTDQAWTFYSSISANGTITGNNTTAFFSTWPIATGTIANGGGGGNYGMTAHANNNGGSSATSCAAITFIRDAQFGCYFGIDTDNALKIGGWSMGNNAYRVHYDYLSNPAYNGTLTVPYITVSTSINVSDERLKKGFVSREARPLWREIALEEWTWKTDGLRAMGSRVSRIEKAAPEYVTESKTLSVAERLGGTKRQIENAKKRIAAGKERGVLGYDKAGVAFEMAIASGQQSDAQAKKIEALMRRVERLERRLAKRSR